MLDRKKREIVAKMNKAGTHGVHCPDGEIYRYQAYVQREKRKRGLDVKTKAREASNMLYLYVR